MGLMMSGSDGGLKFSFNLRKEVTMNVTFHVKLFVIVEIDNSFLKIYFVQVYSTFISVEYVKTVSSISFFN